MKFKKTYLSIILLFTLLGISFYPLWSVIKTKEKIDTLFFGGNYSEALLVSESQLNKTYSAYTNLIFGEFAGFTPQFFFLSSTGICQYKLAKYKDAATTLGDALAYAEKSNYDSNHIKLTEELLNKVKVKLLE